MGNRELKHRIDDLLQSPSRVEKQLGAMRDRLNATISSQLDDNGFPAGQTTRLANLPDREINMGWQAYKDINVPILAVYATPQIRTEGIPQEVQDGINASIEHQAQMFEKGLPSARVVRLANSSHYIFISNETEVIREINAFLEKLPSVQ